jgi:CheY-like chemotaxis protein
MKVLVVEDDNFMLKIYDKLLALEGFDIETAGNGMDALGKLENMKTLPDLMLLDIMMPKMDGFEFLKQRSKVPKITAIPIIVLTNLYSAEDKEKAKKLGAIDFVVKSEQDPKQLAERIRKILAENKK